MACPNSIIFPENPIVKIRWSYDCFLTTMGFPVLVRWTSFCWIRAQVLASDKWHTWHLETAARLPWYTVQVWDLALWLIHVILRDYASYLISGFPKNTTETMKTFGNQQFNIADFWFWKSDVNTIRPGQYYWHFKCIVCVSMTIFGFHSVLLMAVQLEIDQQWFR